MHEQIVLALAGNQNSGKTTLFNQLTGSNQHVGNFPGVTVERKNGRVKGHGFATVVDLPGIYSLSPYTQEEIVTRDFLLDDKPDGIINIVDATNLERNLYLTLQLIDLKIPMVLALNMMDEVRANGGTVDVAGLSADLGIPVVPIAASKNEGIHDLVDAVIETVRGGQQPMVEDFCTGPAHRCIHSIAHLVEDHAEAAGVPKRFAATKLVEGDKPMADRLGLSGNELETIEHAVREMEGELETDREAALADMRYGFIEGVRAKAMAYGGESRERARSVRIDRLLTHPVWAVPIFLGVMLLVFWLTFGIIGQPLSGLLADGLDWLAAWVSDGLMALRVNPVVRSLVVDGAMAGVGAVLSFLPLIIVLFFFLSILEDTGYMARVAFVMDKPLRKLGLSGRSIVPLLIGFGCTVPAAMATRTLSSDRDRKMTILLIPFMSCSAKIPIYAAFSALFFPGHGALVMMALYVLGIAIGILLALLLKNIPHYKGKPAPFVMELPNYRLPSPKSVLLLLWDKAKDFLTRAFTIVFLASIVIWFLRTLDWRFDVVASSEGSMLAQLARWVAPLFAPLGFGAWQPVVALLSGFMAKEAVIGTFAVLSDAGVASLPEVLQGLFSPLSACSFLVFTLLYTPCVAAVSSVKREFRSGPAAVAMVAGQCAIAWVAAFLVYQCGRLLTGG